MLWETGTIRGAIVESAEADRRRTYRLRTGMTCGNAVIGLLDSRGVCIGRGTFGRWITRSRPRPRPTLREPSLWIATSGPWLRTTQAAAKGLYYQWGRKDPFSYPALATDAYTQAPTVYAPGFEYAESNPRTSGTESPYDVMTLEWATAHPTTYMDGVFYENGESGRRSPTGSTSITRTLWGNVTTGT